MSLGTTYSLTVQGKGLHVTKFDQCLRIVTVIGKCTDIFRGIFFGYGGVEEGFKWGDLSMEEFFMAEDNFHEGAQDILALFKTKQKQ